MPLLEKHKTAGFWSMSVSPSVTFWFRQDDFWWVELRGVSGASATPGHVDDAGHGHEDPDPITS